MTKICNYCGHYQEEDEDKLCECGSSFTTVSEGRDCYSWERDRIMAKYQGDLYNNDGSNNINNVLEWKRAKSKRRGTYRIG